MEAVITQVQRRGTTSPVLYRREYCAVLELEGGQRSFELHFNLERDPLGGWKVQIEKLDKTCPLTHDTVVQLVKRLEKDKKLL